MVPVYGTQSRYWNHNINCRTSRRSGSTVRNAPSRLEHEPHETQGRTLPGARRGLAAKISPRGYAMTPAGRRPRRQLRAPPAPCFSRALRMARMTSNRHRRGAGLYLRLWRQPAARPIDPCDDHHEDEAGADCQNQECNLEAGHDILRSTLLCFYGFCRAPSLRQIKPRSGLRFRGRIPGWGKRKASGCIERKCHLPRGSLPSYPLTGNAADLSNGKS